MAAYRLSWAQAALEAYQPPPIAAARMAVTAVSAPCFSRAGAVGAVETAPTLREMVAPVAVDGE